jgi:hypothetical protein
VPGPDAAATLGSALRAAREAAGRSVEQVSADTRIRATLIRDLEADSYGSCGGLVYARGHIKSIASSLRVDPAPLLALFDAAQDVPGDPVVELEAPVARPITSFGGSAFAASAAALTPERRGPRWGVALTGAASILIAITAIGYVQQQRGHVPATQAGLSTQPSPSATASTPTQVRTPDPNAVASKPAVTGAQLRVRLVGGTSWVSISNATTTLFEGILKDGEFRDFSDPNRLKVVVGNALAVNLNCGGRDSGPAGPSGQVKHFQCTAAGLTSF